MVQRPKLKAPLRALGEWFDILATQSHSPSVPLETTFSGVAFWDEQEGFVYFTEAEADQYRRHLASLVDAVTGSDEISGRAVETAYQRAIFAVLDMQSRRSAETRVRRETALHELEKFLTGPLHRFRVVVPVNGLATEGLPTNVGIVTLALFDEEQATEFRTAVDHLGLSGEQRRSQLAFVDEWGPKKDLAGRPVAIVQVDALDWGAAEVRCIRELRLTLDVINFFGALVPFNHGHLSLPGDSTTAKMLVAQLQEDEGHWAKYNFDNRWVGPLGELSMLKLAARDAEVSLGFAYVSRLLGGRRNELQERLSAALQWAGRATVAIRGEEAFLLYAIALEAFLLAEGDRQELSYRLGLRVAHLLGRTVQERRRVSEKVKDLYAIRSAIVHNGHYQVTAGDLSLIRSLTMTSLVRVCTEEAFASMSSRKELSRWFEEKLLESRDDRSEKEPMESGGS